MRNGDREGWRAMEICLGGLTSKRDRDGGGCFICVGKMPDAISFTCRLNGVYKIYFNQSLNSTDRRKTGSTSLWAEMASAMFSESLQIIRSASSWGFQSSEEAGPEA